MDVGRVLETRNTRKTKAKTNQEKASKPKMKANQTGKKKKQKKGVRTVGHRQLPATRQKTGCQNTKHSTLAANTINTT